MSRSPYYLPEQYISYMLPPVIESLTCVALGHRILQSVDNLDSKGSMVLAKRLQSHRGKAISLLSAELRKPDTQTSDETMVCILIFLLSEVLLNLLIHFLSLTVLDSTVYFSNMAAAQRWSASANRVERRPERNDHNQTTVPSPISLLPSVGL